MLKYYRWIVVAFAIFFATVTNSTAVPLDFKDHNCGIDCPAGWKPIATIAPQILTSIQSPDHQKTVMLVAIKNDGRNGAVARRSILAGAQKSIKDAGWEMTDEPETALDGVPFIGFSGRGSTGKSAVFFAGATEDDTYMLQGAVTVGDAHTDLELQSIFKSFHLLSPAKAVTSETKDDSLAFRVGCIGGAIVVIAIVWSRRRAKVKRSAA